MAEISKAVADRVRIARTVLRGMEQRGAEVARAASAALATGEAAGSEARLLRLIEELREVLSSATEALAEAERARFAEQTDDAAPRQERDAHASALRELLFRARDGVGAVYGEDALGKVGLEGEVPLRGDALVAFSRGAAALMEAADLGAPLDAVVQVDRASLAGLIRERAEALSATLDEVEVESRELDAATEQRDEAQQKQARIYRASAEIFESLCRLGGLDRLADQLRPTARRRRGRPEPADLEEE